MGISSMRDLLSGSSFNRPGVRRSINAAMVVEAANRIIPGYLPGMQAFEVVAISFKNGSLRLRVKSAAARHGLAGMEKELLAKLRQEFPSTPIDRIQTFLSKEPSRYELS
ncbi:MAG TPA: DciA family protein [Patescibacteria group bacterium]|nr:DciA family protein [Patescibacteria group bacterium]